MPPFRRWRLIREWGFIRSLSGGHFFFVVSAQGGEGVGEYLDLVGIAVFSLAFYFAPGWALSLKLVPRRIKQSVAAMSDAHLARLSAFVQSFFLSFASQVFLLGSSVLVGLHLNRLPDMLAVPQVFFAKSAPLSPGELGFGEAVASILFLQFGMLDGAVIMLVVRLWLVLAQLPGGEVFRLQGS